MSENAVRQPSALPADFGPRDVMAQSHVSQQQISSSGPHPEGSYRHVQRLQRRQEERDRPNGAELPLEDQQSFNGNTADGTTEERRQSVGIGKGRNANDAGQPVRRRISRACDQCNHLRTKCDGKHPCTHCVEFGLTCEYARERKKRGKASRKDIAAQQAAAHASASEDKEPSPKSGDENEPDEPANNWKQGQRKGTKRKRSNSDITTPQLPPPRSNSQHDKNGRLRSFQQGGTVTNNAIEGDDSQHQQSLPSEQQTSGMDLSALRLPTVDIPDQGVSASMGDYSSIDDYHRSILHPGATMTGHNILRSGTSAPPSSILQGGTITGYGENPYAAPSPNSHHGTASTSFRIGDSPLSATFLGQPPLAGSPGWLSLPSPSAAMYPHLQHAPSSQILRYPVLRPLLPHISAIIPIGLACDLLELYFSSNSSPLMQPQSPYTLAHIFRKESFLRQHNPRTCSPALLASMLWIAAQTSESAFLTSPPSARGRTCQKLLELTVSLLRPLVHTPMDGSQSFGTNPLINGVFGGLGATLPGQAHETEGSSPGAIASLDDVATYYHIATVVSASEYKAASLRWWNAAWSLARELKLGRELPANLEPPNSEGQGVEGGTNGEFLNGHTERYLRAIGQAPGTVSEEEREERRRLWWLLYVVDRHLAICYNRPVFLLDTECDGLLQPEDETIWQAGEYYPAENHTENRLLRQRGPNSVCTGHSIFGYFLPLMTILGEILNFNHARNHTRFGLRIRNVSDWDNQAAEIRQQLGAYGRSLKEFETRNLVSQQQSQPLELRQPGDGIMNADGVHSEDPLQSVGVNNSTLRMTEAVLQTKIVVAYGTHLMHTLHILLNGKWDPISLLDDNDLWISSQSFISATGHAVSAAEALNDILDYDPDLSFMPFFFGIYLLQGSFLLLLIAEKLQGEASPNVVKACETIVRAHEACVVTLNTEYQRNFRKVMRSALAQVRGRSVEGFGEQQLRRREVLSLYRWTPDGTGLAL